MAAHGVMFHHFHGEKHPQGQGSISAEQFADLLEHVGLKRILPARQWLARAITDTLADDHICLTFDDNLRCQFDIALPVLENYGLTAFWFVYTSVLQGALERLELYRKFRDTTFASEQLFYDAFDDALQLSPHADETADHLRHFDADNYLTDFPFYNASDRRFRFVRDEVLGPQRYNEIMDSLITMHDRSLSQLSQNLWMDDDRVVQLHRAGHVIGLHSHTHPTRLANLDAPAQREEYRRNSEHLAGLLGTSPVCMSHPCNSYNDDTLHILRELGVVLGFRANLAEARKSELEYPRADHANILAEMPA